MNGKAGTPSKLRRDIGLQVSRKLEDSDGVVKAPTDLVQFYYRPHFLDDVICDALIAMIDAGSRPSTLLTDRNQQGFRTSSSCDMDRHAPEVAPIDRGIATFLGLDPAHGETMQGQRYEPGQQFRAHHDWFHEGESYWAKMKAQGGQRTWTAMIFLNDVEDGGATWFPQAGLKVAPARGLLLAWNNMLPDGSPNLATLHEGMPVLEGTKYIITKWFREGVWGQPF
jgi:prolyl 4-hydroxylase